MGGIQNTLAEGGGALQVHAIEYSALGIICRLAATEVTSPTHYPASPSPHSLHSTLLQLGPLLTDIMMGG